MILLYVLIPFLFICYLMRNDSEMKSKGIKPENWWKINGGKK